MARLVSLLSHLILQTILQCHMTRLLPPVVPLHFNLLLHLPHLPPLLLQHTPTLHHHLHMPFMFRLYRGTLRFPLRQQILPPPVLRAYQSVAAETRMKGDLPSASFVAWMTGYTVHHLCKRRHCPSRAKQPWSRSSRTPRPVHYPQSPAYPASVILDGARRAMGQPYFLLIQGLRRHIQNPVLRCECASASASPEPSASLTRAATTCRLESGVERLNLPHL